ncbi:MAG: hypothetical protein LBQ39_01935 [Tannerellaceae bacterium]|jgi:hypothetical protein|nr:hypothetical protein [Tannerellaceae bacterium]
MEKIKIQSFQLNEISTPAVPERGWIFNFRTSERLGEDETYGTNPIIGVVYFRYEGVIRTGEGILHGYTGYVDPPQMPKDSELNPFEFEFDLEAKGIEKIINQRVWVYNSDKSVGDQVLLELGYRYYSALLFVTPGNKIRAYHIHKFDGFVILDNEQFIYSEFGTESGVLYIMRKSDSFDFIKINNAKLGVSQGNVSFVTGNFFMTKKGRPVFEVTPGGKHWMLRDSWDIASDYRGNTLPGKEDDRVLYFKRNFYNGDTKGNDYCVVPAGWTRKCLMSIDAETDGLWGKPFAIAAIVYDTRGVEVEKIALRMPDESVSNSWVRKNVLPTLSGMCVNCESYENLISNFAAFYLSNKSNCEVICHMEYIVEAFLFREMHRMGFIGDWDAPYPLFDISGNLQSAGEDPTSVDGYAKKHGLEISDYGSTHNPLYDCEVAAKCYLHMRG